MMRCDDDGGAGSPLCMRDVHDSSSSSNPQTSTTSTTHAKVELVGGDDDRSGNVFALNREGYFGPVCDDTWGPVEANTVCQ